MKKKKTIIRLLPDLKKLALAMKLCIIILLVTAANVMANTGYSQSTKLSMNLKQTSLGEVIQQIENSTEFIFVYYDNIVDLDRKVTVNVKDATVDKILDQIFEASDNDYKIFDRQIVITKKDTPKSAGTTEPAETKDDQNPVSGKVVDGKNQPVPGVSVIITGTTHGTVTNIDGVYTITNVPDNAKLKFSFVGMKTQEIEVAGQTVINVVLKEDVESLEEVVVTGYGNFKKATFTGSANTIGAEKMRDIPVVSVEQKLQGQTSGVFITANSGQPAALPQIRIRGMGSFSATNQPLYIIDGVPVSTGSMSNTAGYMTQSKTSVMATLNPNDIENITVIKDAAAASLYGSRAANGVILITTKTGKAGATKVDLTVSAGISNLAMENRPMVNGEQRRELVYESLYNQAVDNGNADPTTYADNNVDTYAPKPWSGYTDWNDYLLRKHAYSQNYQASISGGDENSKFMASIGWMGQDGIAINSDFERYSGNLNYERKLSDKFEASANFKFSQITQNLNEERGTLVGPYFLLGGYITPSDYPYNEDGSYNRTHNINTSSEYNVIESMTNDINRAMITKLMTTGTLSYEIIDGLKLKESLNYDYTSQKDKVYYCPYSGGGPKGAPTGTSEAWKSFTEFKRVFSSTTLNYVKQINGSHNIDALVAFETEDFNRDNMEVRGRDIASTAMTDIGATSTTSAKSSSPQGYRLVSYISRINYDYMGKYYLGASFRRDGTSKLSQDSRWGNFWSVSGMWRLIEEPFMEGLRSTFTDLKFRSSYGVNGNLPNSYYAFRGLYSFTQPYMGQSGSYESTLENNDLKWEKNYNLNIGLDFTVFDRISVTAEYYSRQTKDLLYSMPLSHTSGFTAKTTNIGHISNKGFELEFNTTNIQKKDFTWTTNLSFSHNENEIQKINDEVTFTTASNRTTLYIRKVGGPFYEFYLKEYAGVDPDNGDALYYLNTENADGTLNKNTTNKASEAQLVDTGKHAMPKLTSNMTNSVYYKNFDFSFTFTGAWGGYTFDYMSRYNTVDGTNLRRNFPEYTMNRWQEPGDKTDVPRLSYANDTGNLPASTTRYLHSNDYIRLKSLTFGYTLPERLVQKAYMNKVRFYLSGANLFTHAAWDQYDPETEMGGFTWASAPMTKNVTVGVNITF